MLLCFITNRQSFIGSDSEQRAALLHRIADAARAGVDYIQLREKDLPATDLTILARQAIQAVRDNSATTKLVVNTHADIALAVGADGVHLPAGSPPADAIRTAWLRAANREPIIGVSAHTSRGARDAAAHGAGFAVLAPIFGKLATGAMGIGLDVLREACIMSPIPILALGGVNLSNAKACIDAGAAGVAGIRLFQQGEVAETVRRLRAL